MGRPAVQAFTPPAARSHLLRAASPTQMAASQLGTEQATAGLTGGEEVAGRDDGPAAEDDA